MASEHYTEANSQGAASKFGQMIGEAFEHAVAEVIIAYLEKMHPEYELLAPEEGKKLVTVEMMGGLPRQLDTVLATKGSADPVALLETKWLKDGRHHNDKGAWILQLREVKKRHATVRGAAALLAGYWTEGVGLMLQSEGGIKMVLVATDQEVYETLQQPLDDFLEEKSFVLDAVIMRKRLIRPWDLANYLIHLKAQGGLTDLARSWLEFGRDKDMNGNTITGKDKVEMAINELLTPLPENPGIKNFEITLQIDTGNVIHETFSDVEAALDFIQTHFRNPEAILKRITPKSRER